MVQLFLASRAGDHRYLKEIFLLATETDRLDFTIAMEKKKGCLIVGISAFVLYLVVAAIAILASVVQREDFHSSPTVSRDTAAYRNGSLGLLKEPDIDFEQFSPAEREFGKLTNTGGDDKWNLTWEEDSESDTGEAIDPWVGALAEGDKIELVAFATWYPKAGDRVGKEADFSLKFYDAKTFVPLSEKALIESGVDPAMLTMDSPIGYETPRIRLLFHSESMGAVCIRALNIGDQRTGARVSYDLEKLDELESRSHTVGEWTSADAALLLWHDSPLDISIAILTGEAEFSDLPKREGEQVVFGDDLRVQWLADFTGEVDAEATFSSSDVFTTGVSADDPEATQNLSAKITLEEIEPGKEFQPETLIRASSPSYLKHCGRVTSTGIDWQWSERADSRPLYLASFPTTNEPTRLVFLPHLTEVKWKIDRIPDAPNQGEIEDLFEITLPRITVSDLNGERNLIGLISTAAQVEFDYDLLWSERPPKLMPEDWTFLNETPQSLLNWYLDNTKGSFVIYDEESFHMRVNERDETWWEAITRSLQRLFYGMPLP